MRPPPVTLAESLRRRSCRRVALPPAARDLTLLRIGAVALGTGLLLAPSTATAWASGPRERAEAAAPAAAVPDPTLPHVVQSPAAPLAVAPSPPPAAAAPEDLASIRRQIEALRQQLDTLEQRLRQLEGSAGPGSAAATAAAPSAAPTPAASAEPAPAGAAGAAEAPAAAAPAAAPGEAPAGGVASQISNYFNPSVSVIGNFLGVAGQNHVSTLPSAELRESELGLQAIVDPYARADFFLSFGEHGVDVEEGYVTFTSLPQSLLAKVGRMRVAFGAVNSLHLHVLPWPDEPLTVVNLLGGEDGWIGTGVSLARLLPLPGDTFSEITAQVFRGDSPNLFSAPRRGDLAYNGHYRIFRDLGEATNLTLGLSYAYGPNGTTPDATTRLEGIDFILRYKPLVTGLYHSLAVRGEVMRSDREQPGGDQSALGWYAAADYQFARRWFAGARLEESARATNAAKIDTGKALILTFWPSEFSQLRAELRRRHYGLEQDIATELLLQLQFAIGAHGAHPF
jgi:hypothetical protein